MINIYKENTLILTEDQKYTVTFKMKLFLSNCYDYLIEIKNITHKVSYF